MMKEEEEPASPGATSTVASTEAEESSVSMTSARGKLHATAGTATTTTTTTSAATQPQAATARASPTGGSGRSPSRNNISLFATLFGECLCDANSFRGAFARGPSSDSDVSRPRSLYVELDGVECINLGSVEAEQTPPQRVRETINQLCTDPTRLISIGHLVDGTYHDGGAESSSDADGKKHHHVGFADDQTDQSHTQTQTQTTGESQDQYDRLSSSAIRVKTQMIPLEIYESNHPGDLNSMLSRRERAAVRHIRAGEYREALRQLEVVADDQKRRPNRADNKFLAGMTLHNIAVVHLLDGNDDEALRLFGEAAELKKAAFGPEHPAVAESLDEIGIQYFARERPDDALRVFTEARKIRINSLGQDHPKVALVLSNMGCVYFQQGRHDMALASFQEARDILEDCMGSESTRSNLDLLHVATTLCNLGYMKFRLKQYEDATSVFEDALLVQQSVLGDNHKTIKDTLGNIALTNAFHS